MKKSPIKAPLLAVAVALAALVAAPVTGSAANLSGSSFAVKAVNKDESAKHFAVRPFFSSKAAPTPEPTAPVTTAPPFTPTVVFSHDGVNKIGTGILETNTAVNPTWISAFPVGNVTGQPAEITSGQVAFSFSASRVKERNIRLTVPQLEAGTYSFSIWASAGDTSTWSLSTQGATPKTTGQISSGSWIKHSITFTTDSAADREIILKATLLNNSNYTIYFDKILLQRTA